MCGGHEESEHVQAGERQNVYRKRSGQQRHKKCRGNSAHAAAWAVLCRARAKHEGTQSPGRHVPRPVQLSAQHHANQTVLSPTHHLPSSSCSSFLSFLLPVKCHMPVIYAAPAAYTAAKETCRQTGASRRSSSEVCPTKPTEAQNTHRCTGTIRTSPGEEVGGVGWGRSRRDTAPTHQVNARRLYRW